MFGLKVRLSLFILGQYESDTILVERHKKNLAKLRGFFNIKNVFT